MFRKLVVFDDEFNTKSIDVTDSPKSENVILSRFDDAVTVWATPLSCVAKGNHDLDNNHDRNFGVCNIDPTDRFC